MATDGTEEVVASGGLGDEPLEGRGLALADLLGAGDIAKVEAEVKVEAEEEVGKLTKDLRKDSQMLMVMKLKSKEE